MIFVPRLYFRALKGIGLMTHTHLRKSVTEMLNPLQRGNENNSSSSTVRSSQSINARFEVFTAVTMKNAVFWNVTLYDPCKNRRFGGTSLLHHQGDKNQRTLARARATQRNIPEDGILQSTKLFGLLNSKWKFNFSKTIYSDAT
jgi:hypothetical protein